jgi:anti-sigma B factor antagonist
MAIAEQDMAVAEQDLGSTEFGFEICDADEVTLVELAGELDLATAPQLRECLARPEVLDSPVVCVDLGNVTFLGSTGIGLLVAACKRVRSTGGAFSVRCRDEMVLQVLQIMGLVDFLEVERPNRPAPPSANRFAKPPAG